MKVRFEWYTNKPQAIREIMWLLKKYSEAETDEERDKYIEKINNWKRTYPREAEQLDKNLEKLIEKELLNLNRREKVISVIKT